MRARRLRLSALGLLLAALLALASITQPTDAAWVDTEHVDTPVSTGTLPGLGENLTCIDSESLLDLLNNQVRLDWSRPATVHPHAPVVYDLTWRSVGLLTPDEGEFSRTGTTWTFQPGVALVGLNTTLTVTPRVGTWTAPSTTITLSTVSLLGIGLRTSCDMLLGIL